MIAQQPGLFHPQQILRRKKVFQRRLKLRRRRLPRPQLHLLRQRLHCPRILIHPGPNVIKLFTAVIYEFLE